MATALAVGSMIFPASAANCASGKIYSDYLNGTGEKGTFTVYTGGRVTTETSDTRPLYGMVTPNTTGYTSTVYVWYTYYDYTEFMILAAEPATAVATDSYARATIYCNYNDSDPIDARARFWIESGSTLAYGQICSHFNDDTSGLCSHGEECPYNITSNWTTTK